MLLLWEKNQSTFCFESCVGVSILSLRSEDGRGGRMTREKAIKVLRETYCGNRVFCELFRVDRCRTTDCEIYHAIKALEVEPIKHGRWIYKGDTGWHCSECDMQAPFWCFASTQNLSAFCPNCGAKMDEE